ncbi:MAG: response regulator [Bdellovibrionales bacterium]|nr:response regulator [Bdellovibrionales bacterium]
MASRERSSSLHVTTDLALFRYFSEAFAESTISAERGTICRMLAELAQDLATFFEAEGRVNGPRPMPSPYSARPRRFLIVEDDATSSTLLAALLAAFGTCTVVGDGREGLIEFLLALESGEMYDALFVDIMMPLTDGRKLLRLIRRAEQERGIGGLDGVKVLMTTSLQDPASVVGSFADGCEGYLVKPVSLPKLTELLEKFGLADSDS